MDTFLGYRNPDGRVGVRNHVAIIPAVICANTVVQRIAQLVPGTVALPHPHGCAQIGDDAKLTMWSLAGAAANPNVGAALIVGLGCETCQSTDVLELARERSPGKQLEQFSIQEAGGSIKAIQRGMESARGLVDEVSKRSPEPLPLSELVVATECGGYDVTSARAANPTVGLVSDWLIDQGATVLMGETSDFVGAEQVLAQRAGDEEIVQQLRTIVARVEADAQHVGDSVTEVSAVVGTGSTGFSSLNEASLGCISKSGSTDIKEVIEFSDRPSRHGLVVMDTPSHDTVALTGMVTGGAQVCIATTGRGSPIGNALAPVINVTANPRTAVGMGDNIDLSLADIVRGNSSPELLAEQLADLTVNVASGQMTAAEIIGHQEFALYRIGPQV